MSRKITKILSLEENVSVEINPGNSKGWAGASKILSQFKSYVFLIWGLRRGEKKNSKLYLYHSLNIACTTATYSKYKAKKKGFQSLTIFFTVKEKPRNPGRPNKLRDPNKGEKGCVVHREESKRKYGLTIPKKPPPHDSCVDVGNGSKNPADVCKQTNWSLPKNL